MIFVVLPPAILTDDFVVELETLGRRWQGRYYLAAHQHLNGYDKLRRTAHAGRAMRHASVGHQ